MKITDWGIRPTSRCASFPVAEHLLLGKHNVLEDLGVVENNKPGKPEKPGHKTPKR